MTTPQDILHYWFGDLRDGWPTENKDRLWFGGHPDDDADIRRRFADDVRAAVAGERDDWQNSDDGVMAFILVTDQMTRAGARGTPAAFAGDDKAVALCRQSIATGLDKRLPLAYRRFLYLPLEHSENISDQRQCIAVFEALLEEQPAHRDIINSSLHFAVQHHDIIAQFGRFPHRNAILGRANTLAETTYLAANPPHFGQK